MLDVRLIRDEAERVRAGCRAKGIDADADVDAVLTHDARRREILAEVETLQHERNVRSKEIGQKKKAGEDASAAQTAVREIGERIKALEDGRRHVESKLTAALLEIPNLPDESVPAGTGPEDNPVVREGGERPSFDFEPKAHWDLAEELGVLDFERGVKIAGPGFPVYKGLGARLERALVTYFLDAHTSSGRYEEVFPPVLVNEDSATGTGQLPDKEGQMYELPKEDLYLIPTAEVPVTNLHRDEILESLPVRYAAFSSCFRREAGSHGRDVRGLNRVHQFQKVELVQFVDPRTSDDELEDLVSDAEGVLRGLGLQYRVIVLCTGDMGFTQAKTYDLEVWAPGQERWLEVSSCTNYRDFQSRRMKIRYRPAEGKPQLVHTLNGSGLATSRIFVAILEHYQRADGSIEIPGVLRPYMGVDEIPAAVASPAGG